MPAPTRGFWQALDDLAIQEAFIVAPVPEEYRIERRVTVSPLSTFCTYLAGSARRTSRTASPSRRPR